jgi:hypothetical protein
VTGNLNGGDIEAITFLLLQQASKSARDDLKATMAHVKEINNAKAALSLAMDRIGKDIGANEGNKKKHLPFDISQGMGNEAAFHRCQAQEDALSRACVYQGTNRRNNG